MRVHKRRRISRQKDTTLFNSFVADIPASKAAEIVSVNRKTADRYYSVFREAILIDAIQERLKANLKNGIEVDESYFGPKRVRGKRGRGAGKKIVVLGLLKRQGSVYTQIIRSTEKDEVMPIIKKVVASGSDIYSDGWRSYDALAVYGYNHKKVKHSENEFAREDGTHINGVESYWSWVKRRLAQFNGILKTQFAKHMLESEWRFNHRDKLSADLKRLLRKLS
ncbi:MAG: IS1595 family transposase [Patescibacteria group bacterium]|nr:IS1595 family transposase [Patescibacteria group bacterium]